jgi:hypothetical protein
VKPIKFDHEKFVKDLQIERSNLEAELASNPSNLGYYAEQAARWKAAADHFKLLRDNAAAQVCIELKDNGGKATADYIKAKQQLNPDFQKHSESLRLAREQEALYEGAVTALDKKQFSLGSLNSRRNTEFDASSHHGYVVPPMSREEKEARRQRVLDAQE